MENSKEKKSDYYTFKYDCISGYHIASPMTKSWFVWKMGNRVSDYPIFSSEDWEECRKWILNEIKNETLKKIK